MTTSGKMDGKFCTDYLPLAAFLHSTGRLRLLGCEPERNNRRHVIFTFDDPRLEGSQHSALFNAGAQCAAADFYDSIRRLRRMIDAALGRTGGGR